MKIKQNNAITVEAPGFVLSNDEMFFDPGFMSTNGQMDYKFNAINEVGSIDENSFVKCEGYDLSNLCAVCELDGQKDFCDLNNKHCESLQKFKQKTGVNIPDLKLEYFHFIPNDFLQKSCILPIFLGNQTVFDNYCAIFPHLKETLIKHMCNPLKVHILELDKVFHFLIIGKYPASIEIMNYIREITRICQKEKYEDLIALNFDLLSLSKQSFENCC